MQASDTAHDIKAMRNMADMLARLDKDSKQLLLCLAPFWMRIPKDIELYIHNLLYHKALPSTAEVVQQLSTGRKPSEWGKQRVTSIISSTGLLLRYGYIIRDLLSLELLSDDDTMDTSDLKSRPSQQYYHVHPLLTLFLRQTVEKERESANSTIMTDYGAVKLAFLDYYTQRSAQWANQPEETYGHAAQEILDEEINFLSAISIPLQNGNPDKLFSTFPLHAYSRFASMTLVNKELSPSASLIAHFSELILQRFSELRARHGDSSIHNTAVETALFASNWLCEYYSESSPITVFRAQIERSIELMTLANNISSSCQESLAILEEQAVKQKSAAVSDGMIDGLQLKKPWNGLIISNASRGATMTLEAKVDPNDAWPRLAMKFSRLQSIAAQTPLATQFSPALSEQLKKDLKVIWDNCINSLIGTDLEPFLASYEWVTLLLENKTTKIGEDPLEAKAHIPSSRFLGLPEFVRSQLMLQLRDTTSAKRYLLDGLQRARIKSNHPAEILLNIRLCDLTFDLRNWSECIAHVEFIRNTMVQLGENLSTADFKAYAQMAWRKGVCHNHLHQWDAALEAFNEALGVCRHMHDHATEYAILRKLAAIKRESGLGEMTVTDALLKALDIAYNPALSREPTVTGERGILLQRIIDAMARQKAGESTHSVIARLACARDTSAKEMHEFIDELIIREKELLINDIKIGVPPHKTEKRLIKLYAEAERIIFDSPRALVKQPLGMFAGSRWERGLLSKRDSL